jgi:outer membrane protein assembly factor BamB
MNNAKRTAGVLLGCVMLLGPSGASAQDWPQWRGLHRDARVTGFNAPTTWPKELTKKWTVTVGDGVATPALVGDKLYVFSRQGGDEVTRCLDAATGKEIWLDKYPAAAVTGAAKKFPGTRSSPAVADGKVVTLGVNGTLSCLDAATGTKVWRKDDFKGTPKFFASCSPIVVDGLCIAQLGGENNGGIAAYDLATGNVKWKWTGDGTAYASPVLLTVDGAKVLVAETAKKIVGLGVTDGKLLWQTSFAVTGRGGYNAATPIVEGQTVIYTGTSRGTKAVKLDKEGSGLAGKELWSNAANSVQYNTPVVRNGLVFGISDRDSLFCINAKTGQTAWTAAVPGNRGSEKPGYGSVVDAGSVLLALTPRGELIVFEPTDKAFKQLAKYRVADGGTYAYPVLAGNRLFVKDRTAVTLWTIE